MLLGSKALKNKTRKEASANPIMMGEEIMEGSDEEKYLGDQIHTDGFNAIILSTINKRIAKSIRKLNEILGLTENPLMSGMKNSLCARNLYVSEVASSIINNCEFWIGVKDEAIDILQDFQNRFMLRFFAAPKQGTESTSHNKNCSKV